MRLPPNQYLISHSNEVFIPVGEVKKIGDEYYIEFYARGLLYQQKAGTDQAAAERLLAQIESKIAHGESATIVRDVDVDIFFQTFLECAAKEHTPKTLKHYQSLIDNFIQFLPQEIHKLSSITPRVIEEYRFDLFDQKPPIKAEMINFYLFLLRDIFDYSIKLGYLNDDPTFHVRFLDQKFIAVSPTKERAARDFVQKGVSFSRLYQLLEIDDILETICYIPLWLEKKRD